EELALGVRCAAAQAIALGFGVERELVDYLTGCNVDDLDAAVIERGHEDLLAVLGKAELAGQAGSDRNSIDDLALRLIEDTTGVGVGAHVEGAGGGGCASRGESAEKLLHGYGNTRSRLRQSLVAEAHLLA